MQIVNNKGKVISNIEATLLSESQKECVILVCGKMLPDSFLNSEVTVIFGHEIEYCYKGTSSIETTYTTLHKDQFILRLSQI
jgi:hypothetical protein